MSLAQPLQRVAQSEPLRMCAARVVRASVDSIFKVRRKPYVIVMGDLNEGPDDAAVRDGLKAHAFASGVNLKDRELVTVMDPMDDGSYKYQGLWDKYDQFVVSASLLNGLGCTEMIDADSKVVMRTNGIGQGGIVQAADGKWW